MKDKQEIKPELTSRSIPVAPLIIGLLKESINLKKSEGLDHLASVHSEILSEFQSRVDFGIKKYEIGVVTHNKRNQLKDAREELLDCIQYITASSLEAQQEDIPYSATYESDLIKVYILTSMIHTLVKNLLYPILLEKDESKSI